MQQLDIQILKAYAGAPTATLQALAEIIGMPESTLRRRLGGMQTRYKVKVRCLVNHYRLGLSPMMLITFKEPQVTAPNIIARYKALSDQPKTITYFVLRPPDLGALGRSDLPADDSYLASKNLEKTPGSLRLWEICYTERQINLENYHVPLHRWEFPWPSIQEWIVSHADLPELTNFPPPSPPSHLLHPPIKLDASGYSVLSHLTSDYRTPLREIAHSARPRVSTTIVHRRRTHLEREHVFVPYLDVHGLQDLATVLFIYRNTTGQIHVSIPLIVQSLLQLAREMPSYTFCILRHVPTGYLEYAVWIDIGKREIFELATTIISLPRSNSLEFYGWTQQACPPHLKPLAASEMLREAIPFELYSRESEAWAGAKIPLPSGV